MLNKTDSNERVDFRNEAYPEEIDDLGDVKSRRAAFNLGGKCGRCSEETCTENEQGSKTNHPVVSVGSLSRKGPLRAN